MRCKTLRAVRFVHQYDDIMESARQRVSARVRTVTELLRRLYASWFYPVLSVSGEARAFRPYVSSPATYGCRKHFEGDGSDLFAWDCQKFPVSQHD